MQFGVGGGSGDDVLARSHASMALGEGIDTSTPAGRLVAVILASIAEFERARIQERIHAGLVRAREQGKAVSDETSNGPR
jgi:DNA invertase Pin-like site-specific DNA recombinase